MVKGEEKDKGAVGGIIRVAAGTALLERGNLGRKEPLPTSYSLLWKW